ncbi:hypothetical protein LCM27_09500 [Ruegeria marisrubri]|uniref:hypothetical protein n=1 Tax=Ruegeria marisrubri TaxID=1685379 RepID=UPI001CD1F8E7|nr:hypothetical protein [Ruegeria marisrubri]MCA0906630.1 hypothetical protein [Ruegeria marisrubri]
MIEFGDCTSRGVPIRAFPSYRRAGGLFKIAGTTTLIAVDDHIRGLTSLSVVS